MRIAVLISGKGSNLQALIDACTAGQVQGQIVGVVSNRADAYGLQRAAEAAIPQAVLSNQTFATREAYDQALIELLDQWQPDLIVMAGFMRILTPEFIRHYAGRMLNIHPSLLPAYPGINTHAKALAAGDSVHGATVHFVTEDLDAGPIVLQAQVPIFADDDINALAERVQTQEHRIYPLTINWFCEGRLKMHTGQAWLDGEKLPARGYASDEVEIDWNQAL